ncbi:MAG TPA: hypothetical protein P5530_01600 [Candidatus Diapherotrites archaeon]|jgi:hypothetical protein|nr:hypothetical protein [Candidatus Diapherotrites archaeon]
MDFTILGFFSDMSFLLKLAFIIFIIIFVRERITKNWLAITAIVIVCIVLVFFYWPVFGSIYVIYILITIGIGSVLVDTFFVTMQEGHGGGTSPEDIVGRPGYQIEEQPDVDMEKLFAARRQAMSRMRRR